jgi:hypothetical protein
MDGKYCCFCSCSAASNMNHKCKTVCGSAVRSHCDDTLVGNLRVYRFASSQLEHNLYTTCLVACQAALHTAR